MYDNIGAEQVKCFSCTLKYYDIGYDVPCSEFEYKDNILIMPIGTRLDQCWENYMFTFIRESKVHSYKKIMDIKKSDFEGIEEVITYDGTKLKIKGIEDLFNYIEDVMLMQVKDDMDNIRRKFNDNYEAFKSKWMI